MQFDCGPRARALPSDDELALMTTRDLLDEYRAAWNWGARCDGLLQQNRVYLKEATADRESVINDLKTLRDNSDKK